MRCEWAVHVVLPSEYRAVNHALSGSSLTKAAHQDVGRASWMCRVAVDVCAGGEVRGIKVQVAPAPPAFQPPHVLSSWEACAGVRRCEEREERDKNAHVTELVAHVDDQDFSAGERRRPKQAQHAQCRPVWKAVHTVNRRLVRL